MRRLLTELAGHLEAAARTIRALADSEGAADTSKNEGRDPRILELTPGEWIALARELHAAIGERQVQLLAEIAKAHPEGIGSGPIARAMNYDQANAGLGLDALANKGLVRKDTSTRPYKYFLGDRLLDRALTQAKPSQLKEIDAGSDEPTGDMAAGLDGEGQDAKQSGPSLADRFQAHLVADVAALPSTYDPRLYLQLIGQYGGVGAAQRLLADPRHTSYGFEKLWELGELERSIEFAVLLPWFRDLFTIGEQEEAERRLILHEFPLDQRLADRSASPPAWTREE